MALNRVAIRRLVSTSPHGLRVSGDPVTNRARGAIVSRCTTQIATAGAVIRMFLRNSGKVLLIGIGGGLFGGTVVSRILQSQLHGIEPFDPRTLAVTCTLLAAAGLFATWLPTRRVARTDPMTALRAE